MLFARRLAFQLPGFLAILGTLAAATSHDISIRQSNAMQSARSIVFFENQGQAPAEILWQAHGSGFEASFGRDYFVFRTFAAAIPAATSTGASAYPPGRSTFTLKDPIEQRISLVKMNSRAVIEPLDPQPGKFNFIRGNDLKRRRGGLATYARLRYANVYPGVDLLFYGHDGKLEYDFVVSPGIDPKAIRLRVEDTTSQITEQGELQAGAVVHKPLLYQNMDKGKRVIEGKFAKLDGGDIGFQFSRYDATKTLVIDPSLSLLYSTYFGGPHDDEAGRITLDAQNNIYLLGFSASEDYPVTSNAYQSVRKSLGRVVTNLVITKISPSGNLLFSTFLGGTTGETAGGIAIDPQGRVYVSGVTKSSDFPVTSNAYQRSPAAGATATGTLSELSSDGSTLIYSTLFGGAGATTPVGVKLGANGNVYLYGIAGPGLPTTSNAYLKQISSGNAGFVSAFNLAAGGTAQLAGSTYYGAATPTQNNVLTGNDIYSMDLDSADNPWIAGQTWTNNLPTTPNALQATLPPLDTGCNGGGRALNSAGFIAQLSADLTTLNYGSYFSGQVSAPVNDCSEYVHSIKLDHAGNVYLGGTTASNKFPVSNGAFQATYPGGGYAEFVSKLTAHGTAILWSTYLGGGGSSFLIAVAPDSSGNVWAGGAVTPGGSGTFPVSPNAIQAVLKGTSDGNVSELSSDGTMLLYSTLLGGASDDSIVDLAVDPQGSVYVAGNTTSRDFPVTPNAFQAVFANGDPVYDGGDIFVTVLGAGTIGAFSPVSGGNTGDTTITVSGAGFQSGATCALTTAAGGSSIQATAVTISATGNSMTCSFALNGAVTGSYDVAITNADGTTLTSQQTFQVNQGGAPNIWSNVAGRSAFRVNVPATYYIGVGNSGNADAYFTPVWIGLDPRFTYTIPGGIVAAGVKNPIDYQQADAVPDPTTGLTYVPLLIPFLPVGASLSIPIQVTSTAVGDGFTVEVTSYLPWYSSRSFAQAELAAYQAGNTFKVPQVCQPADASGLVQDCAGYWINYVASAASQVSIDTNPIQGTPSPTSSAPSISAAIGSFITGLTNSLGVPSTNGSSIVLPAAQTAGGPAIGLDSAILYLASRSIGISTGGGAAPAAKANQPSPRIFPPPPCSIDVVAVNPVWENYDTSACFGTFRVREWRSPGFGTDANGNSCTGYIYMSTENPCFPTTPPMNKCPTKNPSARGVGLRPADGASCSAGGGSIDPNEKSGPTGDGSPAQYIRPSRPLTYHIGFENQPTATLPASQVIVTDQLDPAKVDLSTLTLGTIGFGGNIIGLPSSTSTYNTTYPVNSSLSVRIQGSLNPDTGLLTWTFTSIDPTTGLTPSDPTVGFLPPDKDGVQGQGSLVFNVMPKSGIATGTQITNQAKVVFDANAPINTATWLNTIDRDAPSSRVTALPATESQATFNVAWSGSDKGAGIASYTIHVSDNGGPFVVWQSGTGGSSAAFTAQPGHVYNFYSISTDGAGNVEPAKNGADTTTAVSASAGGSGALVSAVVNGANFQAGPLAGGTIFTIFGSNLASGVAVAGSLPLPQQLGGVSVTLQGLPVPLIYVSSTQINAQIPYGLPDGSASLVLMAGTSVAAPVGIQIGDVSPGLFLAGQHAAAQNQDFSANTPANPAAPGSVLQVYFTGQGGLDRFIATGAASPGAPPANVVAPTTATIGGQNAVVIFSGMTPGIAGLAQANITVPTLAPGDYPLLLTVGGITANSGTVSIGAAP